MKIPENWQNYIDQEWATIIFAAAWALNALSLFNRTTYKDTVSTHNPNRPFQVKLTTELTDIGMIYESAKKDSTVN